MITTIVAVMRVPGGWQVVTTSAYPDARQRTAADLARRLVASPSPFGTLRPGAGNPPGAGQVFLIEAEVVTGVQREKVFGTHLVLASAVDTGTTTGMATAVAYPNDAFVKVGHARTLTGAATYSPTLCAKEPYRGSLLPVPNFCCCCPKGPPRPPTLVLLCSSSTRCARLPAAPAHHVSSLSARPLLPSQA